jgi:hypothetical protein
MADPAWRLSWFISGKLPRTAVLSLVLASLYASAQAQFATRGISEAPLFPFSLAVGDFNRDGKLDIAVVSVESIDHGVQGYGTTVQVLLGNGDDTFQKAVDYPVGRAPSSVATADLNHDGNLDLVVLNPPDDTISVLLGKGDGTFLPAVNYNTPPGPIFVTTGDFNGDGKPDLATVDLGDGTGNCACVAIFLGNGDGTFQAPILRGPQRLRLLSGSEISTRTGIWIWPSLNPSRPPIRSKSC